MTDLTALVLAFNEAPNLERTLDRLRWAARVVVMDSGSTDSTLDIAARSPNVDVLDRPFDTFAGQCNAGLTHVGTEWTLSLDADYVLSHRLASEIEQLDPDPDVVGYRARFVYCVDGRPLRATLYPPRTVLYRTGRARYEDDGHGHRVHIDGRVVDLAGVIYHDDRKPRARWLDNQSSYAALEAIKLRQADPDTLGRIDRLRRAGLAPLLTPAYCLLVKRLALDGQAGLAYTYERTYAEVLLALHLLDRRLAADHA